MPGSGNARQRFLSVNNQYERSQFSFIALAQKITIIGVPLEFLLLISTPPELHFAHKFSFFIQTVFVDKWWWCCQQEKRLSDCFSYTK